MNKYVNKLERFNPSGHEWKYRGSPFLVVVLIGTAITATFLTSLLVFFLGVADRACICKPQIHADGREGVEPKNTTTIKCGPSRVIRFQDRKKSSTKLS
jgi:hypothetical protein